MNKLLLCIALLLLSCSNKSPSESRTVNYAVRYEVSGFVSKVDIDYNGSQQYNFDGDNLPWQYSFSSSTGNRVSVRARIHTGLVGGPGGDDVSYISARVYLDGNLWKSTSLARGQGSAVEINEILP